MSCGRRLGRAEEREGFTLVTSVPLDFSLQSLNGADMEASRARNASRSEALDGLAVIPGAALLHP